MDKAKLMMAKMGWDYGKGLGKDESGIKKPIRLKHQTSKLGFGFNCEKDDLWWERGFDEAAKKINIQVKKNLPTKSRKIKKNSERVKNTDVQTRNCDLHYDDESTVGKNNAPAKEIINKNTLQLSPKKIVTNYNCSKPKKKIKLS